MLSLVALLAGCDATRVRRSDGGTGGADSGNRSGESGPDACSNGEDDDDDGLTDCDEPACSGVGGCPVADAAVISRLDAGFAECDSIRSDAENAFQPVDIVWVIDNSGSMSEEARIIQENMNNFSATISSSGLDYHVVVVTAQGYVNVPAPLGTDMTRFRYLPIDVQSHDSFARALEAEMQFGNFVRPNSAFHIIFVTDDESSPMGFEQFHSSMRSALGRDFTAHAIVSPPGATHSVGGVFTMNGCTGPNGDAADNGRQYWDLAQRTMGLQLSICTADWSALFSELSRTIAVPTTLPCSFNVPAAPTGMTFDPFLVNVVYSPGSGGMRTLPYVSGPAACPPSGDAWFYDDESAPMRIELCNGSCSEVQADGSGAIDIAFGCQTQVF